MQNQVELVRQAINYYEFFSQYIELDKLKVNPLSKCPFHDDEKPSMSVNTELGLFNCFACGEKGDFITFYQKIHNVDFKQALYDLKQKYNIENIRRKITRVYRYMDINNEEVYQKVKIEPGYDGNRKSFAFKHQVKNKYEKGRGPNDPMLYNLNNIIVNEKILFVEGEEAADMLNSLGYTATTLDSGSNSKWYDIYNDHLKDKIIYLFPDNNIAGTQYIETVAKNIQSHAKEIYIIDKKTFNQNQDIADHLLKLKYLGKNKQQIIDDINNLMDQAKPYKKKQIKSDEKEPKNDLKDILKGTNDLYELATNIGQVYQVDEKMPLMFMIGALSYSVSNLAQIAIPSGHKEPLNLFICVPLESGNRKTSTLNKCLEPIIDWAKEKSESIDETIKIKEKEAKIAKLELDQLYKKLIKSESKHEIEREIQIIEDNIDDIPNHLEVYSSDSTPEKLAIMCKNDDGYFLFKSDEGGIFDTLNGRYANNIPNVDFFNQSFNNAPVKIDRVGSGSLHIQNPRLTVILSPQVKIISKLSKKQAFIDTGLVHRFIFMNCQSFIGKRTLVENQVNEQLFTKFYEKIRYYLNLQFQRKELINLKLSPKAYLLFKNYFNHIEQHHMKTLIENIQIWLSKFEGISLRIIALFHLLKIDNFDPNNEEMLTIGPETTAQAINFCNYIINENVGFFTNIFGADFTDEKVLKVYNWIKESDQEVFTKRDLQRSRIIEKDEILSVVNELEDLNLIEVLPTNRVDSLKFKVF